MSEHCHVLRKLATKQLSVTDAGICSIANYCVLLENLNIAGCRSVTDASLSAISHSCPKLEVLDVSNCHRVTHTGVMAVTSQCALTELMLRSSGVADAAISHMWTDCTQLRILELDFIATDAGNTLSSAILSSIRIQSKHSDSAVL